MATWWLFVAILMCIAWLMPGMGQKLLLSLRPFLENPHQIGLEGNGIQRAMTNVLLEVGLATTIVFSLLAISVIVGTMIQTGFFFNPAQLKFHADKMNPMTNLKQMFSTTALVELLKGFVKLVIVGAIAYSVLKPLYIQMTTMIGAELMQSVHFLHKKAIRLIVMILLVVTVIAVADFLYQRFRYFKSLRMTKQEVKDEYKQMEGDPMVKSRLRSIRLERARKRMIAQVPKADVVVTNPTHYAIALAYDNKSMEAPKVLAKGMNRIAERIREVADENNIPLVSNPPLARALYDTVDVDEVIAPEHYRAVAEVISYVYKLKKKKVQ